MKIPINIQKRASVLVLNDNEVLVTVKNGNIIAEKEVDDNEEISTILRFHKNRQTKCSRKCRYKEFRR